MSFTRHSYLLIVKQTHTGLTTRGHLLTLSKVKKNTKWKKSSITGTLEGLELSNISSSGQDIQKQTTPGNQLTKSMLHSSLKPITDNTPSKIKGDGSTQAPPFAPSLSSSNASHQIQQPY